MKNADVLNGILSTPDFNGEIVSSIIKVALSPHYYLLNFGTASTVKVL